MRAKSLLPALALCACASHPAAPPTSPEPTPAPPSEQVAADAAPSEGGLGLVGEPEAEQKRRIGKLPKEKIKATMQTARPQIEACYHKAREATPALEGTLKLRFTVGETGKVESPSVHPDSTITDPGMQRCVLDVISATEFPAPENGIVIISYPFVFEFEDIRAKKAK